MKKRKAFTLIELIAILVILAIIALIVTPLVMNIVKKAKQSSNERSIDAYGKALEISVATYLLEKKEYPDTLERLKVEYTGKKVICGVQTLNEDGSIYLSKCSVNGVEVTDKSTEDGWYHYGKEIIVTYQEYNVGDTVTYKGINFYVIAPSDKNTDYVTLLKAEPLTVDEVNKYGVDENGVNHVNMYTSDSVGVVYDKNGYGGMAYYTSENCGRYLDGNHLSSGCTTDYNLSEIKYVVDSWTNNKLSIYDLKEDSLGYKTRLITFEELINNLGYVRESGASYMSQSKKNTPSWVYNIKYAYWTMSAYDKDPSILWNLSGNGDVYVNDVRNISLAVRPVINLYKKTIKKN